VFAGAVASVWGDVLRPVQIGGAALILVAITVSEVVPPLLDRRVNSREAGLDNDRSQPVRS
jgi:hypothetical protein